MIKFGNQRLLFAVFLLSLPLCVSVAGNMVFQWLQQKAVTTSQESATLAENATVTEPLVQESVLQPPIKRSAALEEAYFDHDGDNIRLHLFFEGEIKHQLWRLPHDHGIRLRFEHARLEKPLPSFRREQVPFKSFHVQNREDALEFEWILDPEAIVQSSMAYNGGRSEFVIDFSRDTQQASLSAMNALPALPKKAVDQKTSEQPVKIVAQPAQVAQTIQNMSASLDEAEKTAKIVRTPSANTVAQTKARARHQQASNLAEKGATQEAMELLEKNVTEFERFWPSFDLLARLHDTINDKAGALEVVKRAFLVQPQNATVAKTYARRLMQSNYLQDAVRVLEVAPPKMDDDPEFFLLKANVLQRLKEYPMAVQVYQLLLSLNPEDPQYWLGLAVALESNGSYPDALASFNKVRSLGALSRDTSAYVNERISILQRKITG